MANTAKLLELAEHLENTPIKFDIGVWGRTGECGTVACIAGHQVYKDSRYTFEYAMETNTWMIKSIAARQLELTGTEAERLFAPFLDYDYFETFVLRGNKLTAAGAAAVVRKFAYTGIIDWRIAE